MKKDYNSQYLQKTQSLLIELKKRSYAPFLEIKEGFIADIGCGNGDDAFRLSELVPADVNVMGIDHDPGLIEIAKKNNKNPNLNYMVKELDEIDTKKYTFKGIRAERLFQHLEHPQKVGESIYSLLSEDGFLLILETDWAGLNLYDDYLSVQKRVVNYFTDKKVNNGYASRNSISILKTCGFNNIEFSITPFVLESLQIANTVIKIEETIGEAADFGFITKEECQNYLAHLNDLDKDGIFKCQMNMIQIIAHKQ